MTILQLVKSADIGRIFGIAQFLLLNLNQILTFPELESSEKDFGRMPQYDYNSVGYLVEGSSLAGVFRLFGSHCFIKFILDRPSD